MKTLKKIINSFKENKSFFTINIIMGLILIVSIVVSVLNSQYQFIKWSDNYSDTIGVSSQIITAIIALVVSVIGISVSLQNEECFGIKVSKLFLLRIELHYSFLQIILISTPLLRELIDHIDVYETEGTGKNKTQRIVIHYRFVGNIEIPSDKENFKLDMRQGMAVEYLTA